MKLRAWFAGAAFVAAAVLTGTRVLSQDEDAEGPDSQTKVMIEMADKKSPKPNPDSAHAERVHADPLHADRPGASGFFFGPYGTSVRESVSRSWNQSTQSPSGP